MRASLMVAIASTLAAFALFGWAAARRGVGAWALALVVPLIAWLAVLGPWYAGRTRFTPADHQRGMYRALAAWAATDVAVLLVFAR
jgi:hypothetical protein